MISKEVYLEELFPNFSGFWSIGTLVLTQLKENYAVEGSLDYSLVASEVVNNQVEIYDEEEGGIEDTEFQQIYEFHYENALAVESEVMEAFIISSLYQDKISKETLAEIRNFAREKDKSSEDIYNFLFDLEDRLEREKIFINEMVWDNSDFSWEDFSKKEIEILENNEDIILSFFKEDRHLEQDEWKRIALAVEDTLKFFTPKTKEELKSLVDDLSINLGDIDTSKITDMSCLFLRTKRTDFSGIEKWDVSNVRNMAVMFQGAESFNQDISSWDVSNIEDMGAMFCETKAFNQDISGWDVSNVMNMTWVFIRAESFNQDLSKWDVSKVERIDDETKDFILDNHTNTRTM